MPTRSPLLDDLRDLISARLTEIGDERRRLERAFAELDGKVARRGPGRPRGSKTSRASTTTAAQPRKRRKRRGGTRADQAVKLIEDDPGIGAAKIAKSLKVKPNYIYRVLGELAKEGRVTKKGRSYYPASGDGGQVGESSSATKRQSRKRQKKG